MSEKITRTDEEWKKVLTPEQYEVTQRKVTERPFTGKYYHFEGRGTYQCVRCGNDLFSSETKYDSGSGWPSFWAPISDESIETARDTSQGMIRTEVLCKKCGAHLGHVLTMAHRQAGFVIALTRWHLSSLAKSKGQTIS